MPKTGRGTRYASKWTKYFYPAKLQGGTFRRLRRICVDYHFFNDRFTYKGRMYEVCTRCQKSRIIPDCTTNQKPKK